MPKNGYKMKSDLAMAWVTDLAIDINAIWRSIVGLSSASNGSERMLENSRVIVLGHWTLSGRHIFKVWGCSYPERNISRRQRIAIIVCVMSDTNITDLAKGVGNIKAFAG